MSGPAETVGADAPPTNLEGVLDELDRACRAAHGGRVSVADMLATIGERSFGPLLLVPGLIGLSPIGAIPGVPGVMAVIVFLISGQILVGMDHAWIPQAIARRSTSAARLRRAVAALRPAAKIADRFIGPRLSVLTRGVFFYLIALLCAAVALVTPPIELVPLAGIVPNAAIVAFGLAVTARDGLWALIAISFTLGSAYLIATLF